MFNEVSKMNEAFGNPKGSLENVDFNRLRTQMKNVLDEYDEFLEALENKDVVGIRDAICDILVFTLGAGHLIGMPVDIDMHQVYLSNMSKLCHTAQELEDTINFYNRLGVETYVEGDVHAGGACVKSTKDQVDIKGKNYHANKFLKNVNWKEPRFE